MPLFIRFDSGETRDAGMVETRGLTVPCHGIDNGWRTSAPRNGYVVRKKPTEKQVAFHAQSSHWALHESGSLIVAVSFSPIDGYACSAVLARTLTAHHRRYLGYAGLAWLCIVVAFSSEKNTYDPHLAHVVNAHQSKLMERFG